MNTKPTTHTLETIINHLPMCAAWKNQHSQFLGCNLAFCQLSGIKNPCSIRNKTDKDMPWQQQACAMTHGDQETYRARKETISYEEVTINHKTHWLRINRRPLPLANNRIGILCLYEDVTRPSSSQQHEKHKQISKQHTAAKKDFLQQLCHDLKTPLTAISGLASSALETTSSITITETNRTLTHIASATKQMLRIVENFVEHENTINNDLPLQNIPVCLRSILDHVFETQQTVMHNNNNQCYTDLQDTSETNVITDRFRTEAIVHNLVSNAAKYTHNGLIYIRLRLDASANGQSHLVLQVQDSGIGIHENDIPSIFQAYKKLTPSYKTGSFQGSGLGLYVAKRYAKDLGGHISVISTPSQGSTFTCRWPVHVSAKHPSKRSETNTDLSALCVEDVDTIMDIHVNMLQKLGYKVHKAYSASQALSVYQKLSAKPSCCLIDLGLPDMDGHELVKKLRGYQGSNASTFICVSAHRLECQHLNQHTFDQFIQKPCATQDLQDAMALSA